MQMFPEVGKSGSIMLGRGMNFVLPSKSTLRVRITAPRKKLIEYAMKYKKKTHDQAVKTIDKYLESRKNFVSTYFGKDIRKAHYYDLNLNTEYLTLEECAQIVIKAFHRKFPS